MKQVLQSLKSGETYVEDVPIPSVRPGTALVRTSASLVSAGTERMVVDFAQKSLVGKARSRPDIVRQVIDKARREGLVPTIQAAFNRLDQPMPLGYSSAGTIEEMGEGLAGFGTGDRVACAGGGWAVHAEYALVPQNLMARLPDEVSFEQAAFTTLGAIAMHGFRLGQVQVGASVAVIGLGLLGQLSARIALAAGCRVFGVDLDPARVELAEGAGAAGSAREGAEGAGAAFTRGRGFDAVLICADTPSDDPVTLAGEIARDRARVVASGAVGQGLPRRSYYARELTFINSRSYGPGRYDPEYEEKGRDYPPGYVRWTEGRNMEAFVELLAMGRVDVAPLITHRFPIEAAGLAYKLIAARQAEPFLGVLLTYRQSKIKDRKSKIGDRKSKIGDREVGECALGVLGAGNFASAVMLPALRRMEGVRLVGIASARGLNAGHAARKFGFEYAAGSAEEVLEDGRVNTVAILTRHHLHAAQVAAALEAGKHVFCEKPLAIRPEELAAVEAAVREHPGLLLTVGFNRRFAPLSRKLKDFLKDRAEPLHAVYRVNAGRLPLEHWLHDPEQGGGRIVGEGCHFVDYLAFLVGEAPLEGRALALPDAGAYRQDNVQMTFRFPDGSLGSVVYLANGDRAVPKERVEVFCGGRVAVLDDYRRLEMVKDGQRVVDRARLRQDKGHGAIWEAFAAAVREGGEPPVLLEQLFGVSWSVFAALESLRRGEPVGVQALRDRYAA